jgi:hypothetical protein
MDKQPKLRNMDMRFSTWNMQSLYRAGSLLTVSKELSKHKLDLVGVQESVCVCVCACARIKGKTYKDTECFFPQVSKAVIRIHGTME